MVDYFDFYWVLGIFPLWFIIYCIYRILSHRKDGKELWYKPLGKQHAIKRVFTGLMAVVNIAQMGVGMADINHEIYGGKIIRYVYYCVFALAWALSYKLTRFEFHRRLHMSWLGQRFFWPISYLIFMITAILEIMNLAEGKVDNDLVFAWTKIGLLIISAICTLTLTIIAIKHPDDFYSLSNTGEYLLDERNYMQLTDSDDWSLKAESKLSVRLLDYSARQGSVIFHISVKLGLQHFSVRRNWNEFEELHKTMLDRVGSLFMQSFPNITPRTDVDSRMKLLDDYLQSIVRPELMIDVLMDFLSFPIKDRKMFTRKDTNTNASYNLETPMMSQAMARDSVDMRYYSSELSSPEKSTFTSDNISLSVLQQYINVSIISWNEVESYVEYTINIVYKNLDYSISKRYRDFHTFHENLAKQIAPGKPPDLPEKNSIAHMLKGHDPEFIGERKGQLEKYISEVLNDPAYHCPLLFQFIGLEISPERLWNEAKNHSRYIFKPPLKWEATVGGDNKQYIEFIIPIDKRQNGEIVQSWEARRRYREWHEFHTKLSQRDGSTCIDKYLSFMRAARNYELPQLPGKAYRQLSTPAEIETRRLALEDFFSQIIEIPYIHEAYILRQFLNEKS